MEFKKYFILQVDDESDARLLVEDTTAKLAEKTGLIPYRGATCLDEFEALLKDSRALIYVIDGNFTKSETGSKEFLAYEAMNMVKKIDNDAYIIFYSVGDRCKEIADNKRIFHVDKDYLELVRISEKIIGI